MPCDTPLTPISTYKPSVEARVEDDVDAEARKQSLEFLNMSQNLGPPHESTMPDDLRENLDITGAGLRMSVEQWLQGSMGSDWMTPDCRPVVTDCV